MNTTGLTVLAVDDEQTQLEDLARMLRASPAVDEVECAFDGREALLKATNQHFDAIFLDVRMPDLDGVALGRVLRRFVTAPQLVFVSAYETAAVDAFELHALDYLRKPVSKRRVEEALDRVLTALGESRVEELSEPAQANGDVELIAVSNVRGGGTRLIRRGAILYAQSHGDYARIVTDDGRYLLRATLRELEERWAPAGFVRVHRQYLANLRNAVEMRPTLGGTAELQFGGGDAIPVSRRHVGDLRRRLRL